MEVMILPCFVEILTLPSWMVSFRPGEVVFSSVKKQQARWQRPPHPKSSLQVGVDSGQVDGTRSYKT